MEVRMKKIIVATDGSSGSDKALEWAVEAARLEPAEIILVYAAEEFCPMGLDEVDCGTIRCLQDKEAHKIIESSLGKLKSLGAVARGIVESGEPAHTVVAVAKRENADKIVAFATEKHGLKRAFLGSVSARIAENAHCPVVIVK
jgi:nucleotide-binding universal stress UspA family protein